MSFRRDLQQGDQSGAAHAYRHGFLYDQDNLAKELHKLRKAAKATHYKLRLMANSKGLLSIAVGIRPNDKKVQVELAIFGCYLLLLLPGLFPQGHTTSNLNWLKRELSLLEGLRERLEECKPLRADERNFLTALDDNHQHPYEAWLMTLVLSVKTFRDAK